MMVSSPNSSPALVNKGDARMQANMAGFMFDVVEAMAPFDYAQLPPHLQDISRPFFELAFAIAKMGGNEFQTVMALQHLVIAKDAAVRAGLPV